MRNILDKYLNWLVIINPCNINFDDESIYIYRKNLPYPLTFFKKSINSIFVFNYTKINNIKLSNLPIFLFNRENKLKYFIKLRNDTTFINYALLFDEINRNLKSFSISLNIKYNFYFSNPFQNFKTEILRHKTDFIDFIIYVHDQLDNISKFLINLLSIDIKDSPKKEIFNFIKYFSLAFSILFLYVNHALNKDYFIGEYTKLNFEIFLFLISLYFYPTIILEVINILNSNYLDIIFKETNNLVKEYIKVILKLLVERFQFLNFYKKMNILSKVFIEI